MSVVSPMRIAPGPVVWRVLFELHQQPFEPAEPVVAVIDRARLPGGVVA